MNPLREAIVEINKRLFQVDSAIRVKSFSDNPAMYRIEHKEDPYLDNEFQAVVPTEEFYADLEEQLNSKGFELSPNYTRLIFEATPKETK